MFAACTIDAPAGPAKVTLRDAVTEAVSDVLIGNYSIPFTDIYRPELNSQISLPAFPLPTLVRVSIEGTMDATLISPLTNPPPGDFSAGPTGYYNGTQCKVAIVVSFAQFDCTAPSVTTKTVVVQSTTNTARRSEGLYPLGMSTSPPGNGACHTYATSGQSV